MPTYYDLLNGGDNKKVPIGRQRGPGSAGISDPIPPSKLAPKIEKTYRTTSTSSMSTEESVLISTSKLFDFKMWLKENKETIIAILIGLIVFVILLSLFIITPSYFYVIGLWAIGITVLMMFVSGFGKRIDTSRHLGMDAKTKKQTLVNILVTSILFGITTGFIIESVPVDLERTVRIVLAFASGLSVAGLSYLLLRLFYIYEPTVF